jgi:signal transduction histidine kinase
MAEQTPPFADRLENRLEFEMLLADLSSRFINLPPADVDNEIEDALRRVCELLGIDLAVLWQWSAEAPKVITPTHAYPGLEGLRPSEPLHQEQYPWTVQQMLAGHKVAVSSLEELPSEAAVDREYARFSGLKSNLTLPLSVGGEPPVGALAFNTTRTERGWPDALVKRLQLVAQVFTNALARRRAEVAQRNLSRRLIQAHEEERALLARELHDDLTQRLAVLAIDVGRAELAAPDGAQAKAMRDVREGLVRLSQDVHSLAYQLHPSVLEELGLAEAIRTECERVGRQGPIDLSVKIAPLPETVGRDAALCLFRVAQEALNNVVRHASARAATVDLRPMDGGLLLSVRDDGVGFDPAGTGTGRSLGLASMRERVQLLNGTLDVESAPDQGTAIVAWVPVEGGAR